MRALRILLLLLWPLDPEPDRASLVLVNRWQAATAASLIQQLQRPTLDNAHYYLQERLPQFDSLTTPARPCFRRTLRLTFVQYLARTYPQALAQPSLVLESVSEGEMVRLRNALVILHRGRAKVTFFEYRYGWHNVGSRLFPLPEAQQLRQLTPCYNRGWNTRELLVTTFPLPSQSPHSDYFVEQSLCASNSILRVFAQLGR
jgi:hypothetical protein